jgi:hypothetical protein
VANKSAGIVADLVKERTRLLSYHQGPITEEVFAAADLLAAASLPKVVFEKIFVAYGEVLIMRVWTIHAGVAGVRNTAGGVEPAYRLHLYTKNPSDLDYPLDTTYPLHIASENGWRTPGLESLFVPCPAPIS